ncbi:MAG: 16S rRNA (adenine(1518)-N(6)/adenine(1519)-N(6))-dimethyltransferase RsmA [Bacilli bacterium]|nr:16S rRNA (adenine(1518)-N(6)/adenine(1519)-N(6))-dimethyltransferase RsmA [Bacilli bacterium]
MDDKKYFEGVMSYKLMAKKEVGQNFLIDPNSAKRIVDSLLIEEKDKVLEIGSGAGSLTYFLQKSGAQIESIDIDEGLITKLQNDFEGVSNLTVKWGNAMKYDYSSYDLIIGNLPYYITSGIVEEVLLKANKCRRAVFMVQKEAADRLLAKQGSDDYSPLTILLSYVSKAKKLFNVSRDCFAPAPHVDSTVIGLDFDENKRGEKMIDLYRLMQKMFLFRRKTIYNNLKSMLKDGDKAAKALEVAGIPVNARPEQLNAEHYMSLLNALESL